MPVSFTSILNGLSLLNKDNANNAAAKDRQQSGDAAAMERLLKSLAQSKELAEASRQFEADQSYLQRGQRTFERNEDWARETERQWGRDAFQRERDAAMRAQRMEELAKEQEFAAGAPDRASKARLAENEAEYNRQLLRGRQTADALGGDMGMAYELADPNVGRVLDSRVLRSIYEQNPAARLPGVASRQVTEGIDPLTGKPRESRLDTLFGDKKRTTDGDKPAPRPLMNLKEPNSGSQSITNKIINGLRSLSRSPMID